MKPKLEYASYGKYVSEAQAKLNALMPNAVPALVVDGKYGKMTVQRVREFQSSRGLGADGIVGAKTWAALDGTAPATGPATVPGAKSPAPGGKTPTPPNPTLASQRVQLGAKTSCAYGTSLRSLRFAAVDRTIANVTDCHAYGNLGPFGMCQSPYNPVNQIHMQASGGVFIPQPCQPLFTGPWSPGTPIELVGKPAAPALGKDSAIVCAWGGLVTIAEKSK